MCAWEGKMFRINSSLTIKTGNLKYFSFHFFSFFFKLGKKSLMIKMIKHIVFFALKTFL